MNEFVWTPGSGIDANAHARLRAHFPRPDNPMGEAWFMGDKRDMFAELLGDLDSVPIPRLQEALGEIGSGISSFGPDEEWIIWGHFLLPALLQRCHESHVDSLLEYLITSFMTLYPEGIKTEPYRGFRDDVLLTLGRAMMAPSCWNGSDIAIGTILRRSNRNPNKVWRWWDASGDFSSSMFFCLKYLPFPLIGGWARSALSIPSPYWRGQMVVWLVGAHAALIGDGQWPSQFEENAVPNIAWSWSYCVRPELLSFGESAESLGQCPFLPSVSRHAFLRVVREQITEDVFLGWLSSISSVPDLEAELGDIPSTFKNLYLT